MPSHRPLALFGGLLALAAVALSAGPPSPASAERPAPAKAAGERDLKALQGAFGKSAVTVFYRPNKTSTSSVQNARVAGVVEVFGRQYLQLEKKGKQKVLIRADLITSIHEE
jgi:hypothetical protein